MRKRIAYLLRRLAHRLDPQNTEPVVPLEFIDTETLAHEICNRNDIAIVYWSRISRVEELVDRQRHHVNARVVWTMDKQLTESVMISLTRKIMEKSSHE